MSNESCKILLVEDNPGDARLILELLKDSGHHCFNIETVDSLALALKRLSAGGIEAILLDLALPDSKGQETFDKVRARNPMVPIVVLTGVGDETLGLKMVRLGAQDYVAKMELNGFVLARSIRYAIERGASEQQIRKFNQDLEIVVKKRTAELQAANEELEAFSYSVAHDLRAPLRHIDGYCSILLETLGTRLDPEAQNYLDRTLRAAKSMAGTIDELLKLARLGRQKLTRHTTSLNAIVDAVVERLAPETAGRVITWNVSTLSTIECDPGLMSQVFVNLLGNSVKYTRARAMATIEVGQTTIDHQLVTFIRDNGAGFDMKYADKLFTAFQRFHRQDEFEGTGVGLATVRRIIQRHGGRIWAESAPDQGATFYFTIGVD